MDQSPRLPNELIAVIVDHVISSTNSDPTSQWTRLRHISGTILRQVESHFRDFWLAKVCVTVYNGPHFTQDYKYGGMEMHRKKESGQLAHFNALDFKPEYQDRVTDAWAHDSITDRRVCIRFGEGYLNDGLRGGYIVNDTPLPDLTVNQDGSIIVFDWRQMFSRLLVEQDLMKKIGDDLLARAVEGWKVAHDWQRGLPLADETYIELLMHNVKQQKRVQAMKHRIRKQDSNLDLATVFHWSSQPLHKQPVAEEPSMDSGACCSVCSRRESPDIFEIVQQEESMLPLLPPGPDRDRRSMYRLMAEEFGWACCVALGKEGDRPLQRKRASERMGREDKSVEEINDDLTRSDRWDILG